MTRTFTDGTEQRIHEDGDVASSVTQYPNGQVDIQVRIKPDANWIELIRRISQPTQEVSVSSHKADSKAELKLFQPNKEVFYGKK